MHSGLGQAKSSECRGSSSDDRMSKAPWIALLLMWMVLPACRKDHPTLPDEPVTDCIPTPPTPMLGWNFQMPEHVITWPRFNPNDGNEIMFLERPFGSQANYRLHRHVIGSGATSVIISGSNMAWQMYDWGPNGKVLLNLNSSGPETQNIFLCTEDGDSLVQLTSGSWNFNAMWSPSGATFGYQHQSVAPYLQCIYDLNTGATDTLTGYFIDEHACWYSQAEVVNVDHEGVRVWDMASGQIRLVAPLPTELMDSGVPLGVTVLADDRTAIWPHIMGLYRTDLITGVTDRLVGTCNSQYFNGVDYSAGTNKLVTTRITRTPVSDHDLLIATDIVLMNPDGSDQVVVGIPFPE